MLVSVEASIELLIAKTQQLLVKHSQKINETKILQQTIAEQQTTINNLQEQLKILKLSKTTNSTPQLSNSEAKTILNELLQEVEECLEKLIK